MISKEARDLIRYGLGPSEGIFGDFFAKISAFFSLSRGPVYYHGVALPAELHRHTIWKWVFYDFELIPAIFSNFILNF